MATALVPKTASAAPDPPAALYCDANLFPAPDLFVED